MKVGDGAGDGPAPGDGEAPGEGEAPGDAGDDGVVGAGGVIVGEGTTVGVGAGVRVGEGVGPGVGGCLRGVEVAVGPGVGLGVGGPGGGGGAGAGIACSRPYPASSSPDKTSAAKTRMRDIAGITCILPTSLFIRNRVSALPVGDETPTATVDSVYTTVTERSPVRDESNPGFPGARPAGRGFPEISGFRHAVLRRARFFDPPARSTLCLSRLMISMTSPRFGRGASGSSTFSVSPRSAFFLI